MRKTRQTIRLLLASIVAATVFFIPMLALGLLDANSIGADENDSAQRGLVLVPIVFIVAAGIGHALAVWLVDRGYTSLPRFAVGAFLGAAVAVLVLAAPAVAIGSYIGMFSFQGAVLTSIACAIAAAFMAVPASAVWWLAADVAHNKRLHATGA